MAQSSRHFGNRPEEQQMTEPDEWTDEQEEALERWAEKDRSNRHPHDLLPGGRKSEGSSNEGGTQGGGNDVKPEQCAEMREMFKSDGDLTIKQMAQESFDFHRSTIAEHVFGRRCNHDIDVEPADSPISDISSADFIDPEECAEMREHWTEVEEIVAVQDEFDKTYGQTYHHLVGRCKCDHEVPDIRELQEER